MHSPEDMCGITFMCGPGVGRTLREGSRAHPLLNAFHPPSLGGPYLGAEPPGKSARILAPWPMLSPISHLPPWPGDQYITLIEGPEPFW